jgi:hypothetical protein
MSLAEHHDMIKTVAPDRTDQPFSMSILPWRSRRRWPVTNAHGANASGDDASSRCKGSKRPAQLGGSCLFVPRSTTPSTPSATSHLAKRFASSALDVVRLGLQQLATRKQHPPFLAGEGLNMYRPVQADPHHVRNPARIIAVALVDLSRCRTGWREFSARLFLRSPCS